MLIVVGLIAAGCAPTQNPDSWLSDEFLARIPGESDEVFVAHVRDAVFQEHGLGTFIERYSDEQVLELGRIWCSSDRSRSATDVSDELETRGEDVSPGRDFLPPPPIDVIIGAIAERQQPALCTAIG